MTAGHCFGVVRCRSKNRAGKSGARAGIALLMLVAAALPAAAQRAPLAGLDEYLEQARRLWGIPGVAVAVVKGDSVVYARGFGVRREGGGDPVDPETMFAIGSSTKAFTAAAVAILVDEGKLAWDTRVVEVLPGFALADPAATRGTTLRDALSHRTGLPGENLVFWGTPVTRDQIVERLRFIPLRAPPRTRYEYQNLGFVVAGQAIPAVTNQSWDELVTERILKPLGMRRTTTRVADLGRFQNVASPHEPRGGAIRPIPWLNLDNAGPAGSIVSSALDMTEWVRFQLNGGVRAGRRLISAAQMTAMRTATMPLPDEPPYSLLMPDAHLRAYGLGWMLHDYHDRLIVEHAGQTDGMHGTVAFMPEEGLGVVVLTNSVLFGFPIAIGYRIFDGYLGRPPRDWAGELHRALAPMNSADEPTPTRPAAAVAATVAMARYAGRYRNPLYGEAIVGWSGDQLRLTLLGDSTRLAHWDRDSFRTDWTIAIHRGMLPIASFVIGARGAPTMLRFGERIEFARVAAGRP